MKIKPGTEVEFSDGKGGKLTGTVTRIWGSKATQITIRTDEDKPRTFVRYLDRVQKS